MAIRIQALVALVAAIRQEAVPETTEFFTGVKEQALVKAKEGIETMQFTLDMFLEKMQLMAKNDKIEEITNEHAQNVMQYIEEMKQQATVGEEAVKEGLLGMIKGFNMNSENENMLIGLVNKMETQFQAAELAEQAVEMAQEAVNSAKGVANKLKAEEKVEQLKALEVEAIKQVEQTVEKAEVVTDELIVQAPAAVASAEKLVEENAVAVNEAIAETVEGVKKASPDFMAPMVDTLAKQVPEVPVGENLKNQEAEMLANLMA